MIRFCLVALFVALLLAPVGEAVVGVLEVGYEARGSSARLAAPFGGTASGQGAPGAAAVGEGR